MMANKNHLLVVAIDFGTTFSGYAFSYRNPHRNSDILVNKNWGASVGHQAYKTPTSVLTTRDGKFLKFGYEAEEEYFSALSDALTEEEGTVKPDLLLFRHFKMLLHDKSLKLAETLIAYDGTSTRPAIEIFTHAIRYLKDHLLNMVTSGEVRVIRMEEIMWVITVPAIWSDSAKQFMREAAYSAGCISTRDSKSLLIALEPEVAGLCCKDTNVAHYSDSCGIGFPPGTKYLIVDCGGGTVDIACHLINSQGNIREISRASGGPWGGMQVDQNFRDFIGQTFGTSFVNIFTKTFEQDWLEFLRNFEIRKKAFISDGQFKISVPLPVSMRDLYEELYQGKTVSSILQSKTGVQYSYGRMKINHETVEGFFRPVINKIINHILNLLELRPLENPNYIFMVGGFSECQYLQTSMKNSFETDTTKVLIPTDAQLTIMKGAVLFGHRPKIIAERVLSKSYGVATHDLFDEKIHDKKYMFTREDGVKCCDDIFSGIIESDTVVQNGYIKKKLLQGFKDADNVKLRLYVTDLPYLGIIHYVDNPRIEKIGELIVHCEKKGAIELQFTFGCTEISAEAIHVKTGTRSKIEINLLT